MKNYEITFITKEDNREKPIKAILESLGGKILNISSLGQKTFTYPIKKEKHGFYTTVNFEIEPEKVVDLNKKLGLEEEILRFLMISAQSAAQVVVLPAKEVKKTEIIPEPEKEIIEAPKEEIVPVEVEEPSFAKATAGKPEKITKPKDRPEADQPRAGKPVEKIEKPKKVSKKVQELIEEPVSEEERLDALDKKLEELLKE